jgi:hypothetical protein
MDAGLDDSALSPGSNTRAGGGDVHGCSCCNAAASLQGQHWQEVAHDSKVVLVVVGVGILAVVKLRHGLCVRCKADSASKFVGPVVIGQHQMHAID